MDLQLETLDDEIWNLGVYDAHCHPTDNNKRLSDGLRDLKVAKLTIMATRLDDQERVRSAAEAHPDRIVPCFGYHPWFSHVLYATEQSPSKYDHYDAILVPPAPREFLDKLPDPVSLSSFITTLTENLERHSNALLGEVGIDRSFRLPLSGQGISYEQPDSDEEVSHASEKKLSPYRVSQEHQATILLAQLRVAAAYNRAVSVHGVQAHGVLYQIMSELWRSYTPPTRRQRKAQDYDAGSIEKSWPPRICLHSYSGPVDQIRLWLDRKVPVTTYFSFSILVNSHREKFKQVLRAVPDDRLLVESDFPIAGPTMQGLMASIVKLVCDAKGWELREGVKILGANWNRFVYGMT